MKNKEYNIATLSKLALETTYPPIEWVPGFFPRIKWLGRDTEC
jgi:hypothetical protein